MTATWHILRVQGAKPAGCIQPLPGIGQRLLEAVSGLHTQLFSCNFYRKAVTRGSARLMSAAHLWPV